ncbi:tripartite motif-containing protein 16-like [Alosa pseudoharengus]|uniref:tripartite motif-containing protein 16-like n=1 Tax=Alosa pseudoharengus TaxID=34774 RepID=UPI003F8A1732
MAAVIDLWTQEHFNCPICLDLLKDPVTLPCGHSFCMDCITGCLNQEDQKRVYSCPQCRQTFTSRPILGRNTMLAEVVDKLNIMGLQATPPAQCYAGPGDVECDVCTGRKQKSVKSCLVCLSSYCETHLRVHNDLNPGKKHKVIDATGNLQDLICSHHDKLLEVYCRTDQKCICVLCAMDEHKQHDTVAATTQRTVKQRQLQELMLKVQWQIQEKVKELKELRQDVKNLKISAQAVVVESERIFTEMIRSVERRHSEVIELIRDQERAEASRVEEVMGKLEQEIAELKKSETDMEQLSHTEDHILFLLSFPSLSPPSESMIGDIVHVSEDLCFEVVMKNIYFLKEQIEHFCSLGVGQMSGKDLQVPPTESKTREHFLTYSSHLQLDLNTVHRNLCLGRQKTDVIYCGAVQLYPDNPERFDCWQQVLCRKGLTGRCYWEAEWSESGLWGGYTAVSYKGIHRKGGGNESRFGHNNQSWSLHHSPNKCSFLHDNTETELPPVTSCSRIGVFVDHKAGILSFYCVSDTMILLHKVQTKFTQPLYPGFWVPVGSQVKLSF